MKVVLVTRTHRVAATVAAGLDKINTFVENGLSYADAIYICVDIREDLQDISYYEEIKTKFISNTKRVKIIPISNWGKFTFPLNIALLKAINEKYEYIIYQSLEYMTTSICVTALLNQLKLPDTLVVGPAMEGKVIFHILTLCYIVYTFSI